MAKRRGERQHKGGKPHRPVVFVSAYFRHHGVGFFDMILAALSRERLMPDLVAGRTVREPIDQYTLKRIPPGELPVAKAVYLVPRNVLERWVSDEEDPLDVDVKWKRLERSLEAEFEDNAPAMKRARAWFGKLREAARGHALTLDLAREHRPDGMDDAVLWQLVHDFALSDQVRWWEGSSPWRGPNVSIARIGGPELRPGDPIEWTRALEEWIEGQPENVQYVVNLYGTSTENQLGWYYLTSRLPRLRGTVFCEFATLSLREDKRRFRPIRVRRLPDDLLRSLERPVPETHLSSPARDRVSEWLELYRRLDDKFVILVLGERGTGKSTSIKRVFKVEGRPYLEANCAYFADSELARSELFGHAEGAFTGATRAHDGLFKQADGGTLFLDEFHTLGRDIQALLLTALQTDSEGNFSFTPLGAAEQATAKFQLILGSNRPLDELRSKYPRDFWDRIHQRVVHMPPLDKAHELSGAWSKVWEEMRFYGSVVNPLKTPAVSSAFLSWLEGLNFPGNFRDLQRIAILAADLQRAEVQGLLVGEGTQGEKWFAELRTRWAEDVESAAAAEHLAAQSSAPPGSIHERVPRASPVQSPSEARAEFDLDAGTPEEHVQAFRKRLADALVNKFGSQAAASRAMKARGSTVAGPTLGHWRAGR